MIEEYPTPTRLTARQKLALRLERAGYRQCEIAHKMGLRCQGSASRLIIRAKLAEKTLREAALRFMELE